MVTSSFGWLDYDASERRRVLELVDLFREKGTLDELGLGTIRDTFADHFFPGISTIQTRARYFLFIPWIYQHLESERVPPGQADRRARELQYDLVQSLRHGGEDTGVIGIAAGRNIQRPPSTIYWLGLRRWGIRLADDLGQHLSSLIDADSSARRRPRRGENDELLETPQRFWHGGLPAAPADLFERATFALTEEEAMFLHERVQHACGSTLLAACLNRTVSNIDSANGIWDLGGQEALSSELRKDLRLAEFFSLGMEGAVLLYNLMLAEVAAVRQLTAHDGRMEYYRTRMDQWAAAMLGFRESLPADAVSALEARLFQLNPGIHRGAIAFSTTWLSSALASPSGLVDDEPMREAIQRRERRLKGSLSRLHHPRALETWSGGSGLGRMAFRWPNARRIVLDIQAGLHLAEVSA